MLAMQYSLETSGWLRWSSWVKEAAGDVHLCLDARREHHITSSWWGQCSLPHPFSLPLPTNCSTDFRRCTIHSLLPQFLHTFFQFWGQEAIGQNEKQRTAEVLHNMRQNSSVWLALPLQSWVILQLTVHSTHIPEKPLRTRSMMLNMRPGPV